MDFDDVVWSDANDVMVERRVVDLAQGEPIGDHRLAGGLAVADDVGRVEQIPVAKSAQGALVPIGTQDPLPEPPLVESDADGGSDVGATTLRLVDLGTKLPSVLGRRIGELAHHRQPREKPDAPDHRPR